MLDSYSYSDRYQLSSRLGEKNAEGKKESPRQKVSQKLPSSEICWQTWPNFSPREWDIIKMMACDSAYLGIAACIGRNLAW